MQDRPQQARPDTAYKGKGTHSVCSEDRTPSMRFRYSESSCSAVSWTCTGYVMLGVTTVKSPGVRSGSPPSIASSHHRPPPSQHSVDSSAKAIIQRHPSQQEVSWTFAVSSACMRICLASAMPCRESFSTLAIVKPLRFPSIQLAFFSSDFISDRAALSSRSESSTP